MPPTVNGKRVKSAKSAKSANVDALLKRNSDLASFLADGAILWATDRRYDHPRNGKGWPKYTPNGVTKPFVLIALRLTCKDLRVALDERLREWMNVFKQCAVEAHAWYVKSHCCPPLGYARTDGRITAYNSDSEHAQAQLQKCADARVNYSRAWFSLCEHCGDLVSRNILSFFAATSQPCHVQLLPSNACTVLAMATQTCQVHGPGSGGCAACLGGKHCRNLVTTSHLPSRVGESFSIIYNSSAEKHMIFAPRRCVDVESVRPFRNIFSPITGPNDSTRTTTNLLVQAMFHMRGVWPPYAGADISRATQRWGNNSTDGSGDNAQARHLPQSYWPLELFIKRHVALPTETTSLQGMLRLDDSQVRQCEAAVVRKLQHMEEIKKMIREQKIKAIIESVSQTIGMDEAMPFSSLEELEDSNPAIGYTLRARAELHPDIDNPNGANDDVTAHHGLHVASIQSSLRTCRVLYTDVLCKDQSTIPGTSSSDAYAYISGLYCGMYGAPYPARCAGYEREVCFFRAWIKACPNAHDAITCVCQALRFFDGLSDTLTPGSYLRSGNDNGKPSTWVLTAMNHDSQPLASLHFTADWLSYRECEEFTKSVRCLLSRTGCEQLVQIPTLFSEEDCALFKSADADFIPRDSMARQGRKLKSGKVTAESKEHAAIRAACSKITTWYVEAFCALAYQPCTRCAALDLIRVDGVSLLRKFETQGQSVSND